jgi:hypothetical protein
MMDCGGNIIQPNITGRFNVSTTPINIPQIRSLQNDLAFGLNNEPIVIDHLTKYFNEDITNTKELGKGEYCCYDAIGNETKYEIKSRRCKYEQYDTTIIPVHKCKEDGRLVFVFYFTNGLYYIQYDKETFVDFEVKPVRVFRQGASARPVPHFHIPIRRLTRINI